MAISSLRRKLAAALLLPTAALTLAACGGDTDFVIHDNDTFDMKIVAWDDSGLDLLDKDTCSEDGMKSRGMGTSSLPSGVTPTYTFGDKDGHPSCTVEMNGVKLSDMESSKGEGIKHEGDTFTFDMDISGFQDSQYKSSGITSSLSVTFPGEVTDADGGKVSGNTVTFTKPDEYRVSGKDAPAFPWVWVIVGVALVGAIGGGVFWFLSSRKKKAQQQAHAFGAMGYAPQQPYAPGQMQVPGAVPPPPSDFAAQGYVQPGPSGVMPPGPVPPPPGPGYQAGPPPSTWG